jgi:hypothetical protein
MSPEGSPPLKILRGWALPNPRSASPGQKFFDPRRGTGRSAPTEGPCPRAAVSPFACTDAPARQIATMDRALAALRIVIDTSTSSADRRRPDAHSVTSMTRRGPIWLPRGSRRRGYGLANPKSARTCWPSVPSTSSMKLFARSVLPLAMAAIGYVFTTWEDSLKVMPFTLLPAACTSVA